MSITRAIDGRQAPQSIRSRHYGMVRGGTCHRAGHRPDPSASFRNDETHFSGQN